jgi:hypothetical protein
MQTKYIILIGVVGVGAVGAYMYMKNKQAQNALLGALPSINQGGVTTPSGTTTSGTTPSVPTADLAIGLSNDGIQPSQYALNLENAQRIVSDITWLIPRGRRSEITQKYADLEKLGFVFNEKTELLEPKKGTTSTPALDLYNARKVLSDAQWWKNRGFGGREKANEKYALLAKIGYKINEKNELVKI